MHLKDKPRFVITYEVITPASAAHGDTAYAGYLPRTGEIPMTRSHYPKTPARFSLRAAYDLLRFTSAHIEADSSPCVVPRWITSYSNHNANAYEAYSNLSLHLGEISPSSARRVAKLFGTYGMAK